MFFSIACNTIDINDIVDIYKYLMKKSNRKSCLKTIKKLLSYQVSVDH